MFEDSATRLRSLGAPRPPRYSLPSSVNAEAAAERRAVDAWLRSPIDRGQAQTCLHKAGLQNGAYLVRKSTEGTCVSLPLSSLLLCRAGLPGWIARA